MTVTKVRYSLMMNSPNELQCLSPTRFLLQFVNLSKTRADSSGAYFGALTFCLDANLTQWGKNTLRRKCSSLFLWNINDAGRTFYYINCIADSLRKRERKKNEKERKNRESKTMREKQRAKKGKNI